MNDEKYTFTWSFCEMVKTKTGDKEIDSATNKFFKATMNYCKKIRQEIKAYFEALSKIYISYGYSEENMRVRSEMLDLYISYDCIDVNKKKKLTIFTDFDFMRENDIGRCVCKEADKKYDSNLDVAMLSPLTEKMEEEFNKIKNEPFPLQIKEYLTELGIYDECLAIKLDEDRENVDFINVVKVAYDILSDKIGDGITIKLIISDGGYIYFTESESSKNLGRLPEIEVDKSFLLNMSDKKWHMNIASISIVPFTDYQSIGLERNEYEAIAYDYFGDDVKKLMYGIDEGEPFDIYVFVKFNKQSTSAILEMIEKIHKCFMFNMEMVKYMEISPEMLPDKFFPHGMEDGEMNIFYSIFIFSEDFQLVEIPLAPDSDEYNITFTRYYAEE